MDSLPPPDEIAAEIMENLQAALEAFQSVAAEERSRAGSATTAPWSMTKRVPPITPAAMDALLTLAPHLLETLGASGGE